MSAGSPLRWTDSHCHIQDAYLDDPGGAEAVIRRAAAAGVDRLVCIGTAEEESRQAVELARSEVGPRAGVAVWAAVGLHPHEASHGVAAITDLVGRLGGVPGRKPPGTVVAIGECGLDYHYEHSPRDAQREAFAAQILLANSTASPSSSTRATRGTTHSRSSARVARRSGRSSTASPGERPRRVAASISAPTFRSAGSSHSRTRTASGRRPPRARRTACSSRRTHPFSRRPRIAASRTSRPTSRSSAPRSPRCAANPRGPRGGDERQRVGCLLARRLSHGRATTARTA